MNVKLDKQLASSLLNMVSIVEARDSYTGGHLWRVAQYSKSLAKAVGLTSDEVAISSLGGFLHDLGKIAIPDSILLKKDTLSLAEYDIIKTHPGIGYSLIKEHPLADLVKDTVHHHHEWANGEGYPFGLRKDEVSVHARIVSVVDAFDAMTSARSYSGAMPIEKALSILNQERDKQFDGELVDYMFTLYNNGVLEHIVGHSNSDIPMVNCHYCGPIMVAQRDTKDGDFICCNGCTGKFQLHQIGDTFESVFANEYGSAEDLKPTADVSMISEYIEKLPNVVRLAL